MIPISITASVVVVSYPFSSLISFAVYYRLYLSEGKGDEKALKTSFDESDISLGRINTLFIAPPYTVGSLKACIAKVEGLVTPGHTLYRNMELFQDIDSDAAMSDVNVISFQDDTYPGSNEGNPVALVNAAANTAAYEMAKPRSGKVLDKYPLDTVATNRALLDGPDSKFTTRAQLTWTYSEEQFLRSSDSHPTADYKAHDPAWLSLNKDEIVYTDGVLLYKMFFYSNRISFLLCFVTSLLMLCRNRALFRIHGD